MVENFNSTAVTPKPPMGYTENRSPTFLSTGNPCLDFFFHVVPDTPAPTLIQRLQLAWANNPLTTLKLICNLRGVRGTGKSDKEGYYTAVLWIHENHPKTLACNMGPMAGFGCFKDLPEVLYRLLKGSDVRKKEKREWSERKGTSTEARVLESMRQEKKIAMAKKAVERYERDPDYKFLYGRVSDFFAECLKADLELLNSGKLGDVSLAAKWCPSIDSSFDKSTLLCESIARKVFPKESYPEYEGVEDAHYAYRVRDRLRKEVLVPLRKALELPEVYMGKNEWGSLPYNRVASVAMKSYKEKFLKHDKERFEEYLEKVKSGKVTIAAGALLPHEIIGL